MNPYSDQTASVNPPGTATRILRFCIVVGTVIYMAFAAMNTLSFLVSSNDLQKGTFLLQATSKAGNFGANRPELILKAVILDGRLLRWDSVASKSNWQFIDRGGLPSFLQYSDGSKPAFLTFQGVHMLAVFQASNWPGAFRVEHNGREIQPHILRDPAGQQGLIVLESPATPPSLVIFIAALVLFAACARWSYSLHSRKRDVLWLVFFLSVLHFLFWATQCVGTTNDSPHYVAMGRSLLAEGIISYFPPGYPAFLELVRSLSGNNLGRWVTLIQHGMVILGAVWIYRLLQRIVPEELALLGGILAGTLAPSLTIPQSIMSETATLFAMVGALLLHGSVRGGRKASLCDSGRCPFRVGWNFAGRSLNYTSSLNLSYSLAASDQTRIKGRTTKCSRNIRIRGPSSFLVLV